MPPVFFLNRRGTDSVSSTISRRLKELLRTRNLRYPRSFPCSFPAAGGVSVSELEEPLRLPNRNPRLRSIQHLVQPALQVRARAAVAEHPGVVVVRPAGGAELHLGDGLKVDIGHNIGLQAPISILYAWPPSRARRAVWEGRCTAENYGRHGPKRCQSPCTALPLSPSLASHAGPSCVATAHSPR